MVKNNSETLNLIHWVSESPFYRYEQAIKQPARLPNKLRLICGFDDQTQGLNRDAVSKQKSCSAQITLDEKPRQKTTHFGLSKHLTNQNLSFAELIHPRMWAALQSVCLHSSGQKVVKNQSFCLTIDALFEIISNQHPRSVNHRQSLATFNVMKGSLAGSKVMLRNQNKITFLYKWCFLGPQYAPSLARNYQPILGSHSENFFVLKNSGLTKNRSTIGLGINQVFIFQELDRLDYDAFSQVPGFDVILVHAT